MFKQFCVVGATAILVLMLVFGPDIATRIAESGSSDVNISLLEEVHAVEQLERQVAVLTRSISKQKQLAAESLRESESNGKATLIRLQGMETGSGGSVSTPFIPAGAVGLVRPNLIKSRTSSLSTTANSNSAAVTLAKLRRACIDKRSSLASSSQRLAEVISDNEATLTEIANLQARLDTVLRHIDHGGHSAKSLAGRIATTD